MPATSAIGMCCDGAPVGPVVLVLRKSLYSVLAVSALDTLVSNPIGNWDLLLVMDAYTPSSPKKYALMKL